MIMMNRTKNRGFTLIEIAIVLVIIGLLLGGVLKGQELINNAKVKSYATDFRNIPIQLYGYRTSSERYPATMHSWSRIFRLLRSPPPRPSLR